MNELTERQKAILGFIQKEINEKGYPPTIREIGKAVGLKSPASVHNHLKLLEKNNYIRRDPSKPRAIEILFNQNQIYNNKKELIRIPLIGKATTRELIFAKENIEDYFLLSIDYINNTDDKELFMLKIKGKNIINAGIQDGDYVIAQKQNYASNNEIIIVLTDEGITIKRLFKEKAYLHLQTENPVMKPIIIQDNNILGKVIGLYRRFIN